MGHHWVWVVACFGHVCMSQLIQECKFDMLGAVFSPGSSSLWLTGPVFMIQIDPDYEWLTAHKNAILVDNLSKLLYCCI